VSESRSGGRTRQKRAPASATPKPAKAPVRKSTRAKAATKTAPTRSTTAAERGRETTFQKISALCLALPNTKLTMTWGSPHFRVGDKIFCGFGDDDGKQVLGVKLRMEHAKRRVQDPRFWTAPYVGKHGWVSMDVTQRKSWSEVAELIRESYELIAPKALVAKLR
jgi:predicted DNA-binding protein (MmcQ/YjbR family)